LPVLTCVAEKAADQPADGWGRNPTVSDAGDLDLIRDSGTDARRPIRTESPRRASREE
jgi:hypothetical protein